jgi:NAD(P)-dependent dehydrogenase (short-subunit alcohol dehydrogenase family)
MIPRLDAWGVFFAVALLLVPSAIFPISRDEESMTESAGAMRDRVVAVTGVGSTGQLGFAVASKFFAAGARLVVAGHSDAVRGLADQIGPRERVVGVRADLTTTDGVAAVVAAASSFGRLDALINIAGGLTVMSSIEDTTSEKFRHEMGINAETVLLMSRAVLPLLRASRGSIVNFTSPAGEHALPSMGAYSAAKAAVIALTQSLAAEEAANGVRVNAIAPGMIDTDQNRFSAGADAKFVKREQVADAVMFLVSDAASGISGEVVHVVFAGPGSGVVT